MKTLTIFGWVSIDIAINNILLFLSFDFNLPIHKPGSRIPRSKSFLSLKLTFSDTQIPTPPSELLESTVLEMNSLEWICYKAKLFLGYPIFVLVFCFQSRSICLTL